MGVRLNILVDRIHRNRLNTHQIQIRLAIRSRHVLNVLDIQQYWIRLF